MYDPAAVPLPPSFDHGNNPLPMHLRWLHAERDADEADRSAVRAVAINEREAREAAALTYGMITMIDDAVGRILARLEELGLAHDTVVVFTTDHGDFMGDHQLLFKGALHYRGLVRVPFIWADPATTSPPPCWRGPGCNPITATRGTACSTPPTAARPATTRCSSRSTSARATWAWRTTSAPAP